MSSILRGLLQSPASTTLADNGPTVSAGTLRHHQQCCSDQSKNSKSENCKLKQNLISHSYSNSICKLEDNITQEQFWKHCSYSGSEVIEVKEEQPMKSIEGMYYTYTIEPGQEGWSNQWQYENVSPTQLKSPHLDTKNQYFLGKERQKRPLTMNVCTATDMLSQAFPPNEVPDFTQEGFVANCFGSEFGYDSTISQFDDSLLTPPESLDFPKLTSSHGDLSLSDCGEVFESGYNEMDADWLNEPINLHTPDSQDGDVTFSPYTSLTDSQDGDITFTSSMPYTSLTDATFPVTPSTSHPPTPLSSSPSSDVEEVLSLFSDQNNANSPGFLAAEYLPFPQNYESSPEASQYSSPAMTPVHSPYPPQDFPSYCTPQELPPSPYSETSQLAITDLLDKDGSERNEDTNQDRKRKASKATSSSESTSPKPKRRFSLTAKKERKREQNKSAALRYRQKKKQEKNGCFSKLDELESKNVQLKKTVSTLTAEIAYLKKLWSEVSAAKQLKQDQHC